MELIILCEKRFDVWAVQRLGDALGRTESTHHKLCLDLTEVRFLDKCALNYLQELSEQYELRLSNVSPKASLIFDLTGFSLEQHHLAA